MSRLPVFLYSIINNLFVAKRVTLQLGDRVHIQLPQEWKQGTPFFDWYTPRSSHLLDSIQLRKERQSPFFHEYVVFSLRDGGGCFRMDRRLKLDEKAPLDSIYAGVEPYDTIEEVSSFDDMQYGISDRVVEMKFEADVELKLILDICRAIHGHPSARVFTLQRYNGYLFAQTVLICAIRTSFNYLEQGKANKTNPPGLGSGEGETARDPIQEFEQPIFVTSIEPAAQSSSPGPTSERNSTPLANLGRMLVQIFTPTRYGGMAQVTRENMEDFVTALVRAHSIRVGRRWILKCKADEVERDIKTAMEEIWQTISTRPEPEGLF